MTSDYVLLFSMRKTEKNNNVEYGLALPLYSLVVSRSNVPAKCEFSVKLNESRAFQDNSSRLSALCKLKVTGAISRTYTTEMIVLHLGNMKTFLQ